MRILAVVCLIGLMAGSAFGRDALTEVNAIRKQSHLQPFLRDADLQILAESHANKMSTLGKAVPSKWTTSVNRIGYGWNSLHYFNTQYMFAKGKYHVGAAMRLGRNGKTYSSLFIKEELWKAGKRSTLGRKQLPSTIIAMKKKQNNEDQILGKLKESGLIESLKRGLSLLLLLLSLFSAWHPNR